MSQDKTIADLFADLESATERHREAEQCSRFAAMRATDALNEVNRAQKALDAAVAKLKKDAHNATDWKQQSGRSFQV